jgi:peroxiredoxin Q/BCP
MTRETGTDPLIGKPAPPFCLPDAGGAEHCLEASRGKWVVLYFYPRDNTPGCTLEALSFNAALQEFADMGAVVIGVSADTPESHRKFVEKYSLSILLLSDTAHAVLNAYQVWKPKKIMGKEFLGTERSTFLINPGGTIVQAWRKVSVKGHADAVKKALLEHMGRAG